jgi:hypothetical protein
LLIILFVFQAASGETQADSRGKDASISAPSATLDGVKPLANWIWDSGEPNPRNYFLLVRKTFDLPALPQKAQAYISAYAYADVYINGKLLERCPINCDPEYQCYDYFSISDYLRKGKNCITAVVHNFGVGLHSQMNARGGFFFQGKLDFSDGSTMDILTDDDWKVTQAKSWDTETRYRDDKAHLIGFIEEFDARLWPVNWQNIDFNDNKWENASLVGIPPVAPWNSLVVTSRPRLNRTVVKPLRQWQTDERTVYDFGTEIVGYPQFTIDAAKGGVQFEIGTGERLDSNREPLLRVSSDHSEKYTTRQGVQSWRPFTWSGFRYFSIENRAGVKIQDVSAEFACYNYEMDGSFECSDAQLNEFWNIGKHTLRINSIDTYEDPWREHTQYIAGDSRYMQIYGNYAFGKSSRFLSAYNLVCGAQSQRWRDDGAVRGRYPTDSFMQPGSSTYIADYQLEWVLMMHEYFMYYGEDALMAGLYPNMKKAMDYFKQFIDPKTGMLSHIPGWIVLDWPSTYEMEKKDIVTGINCQYYGALNAAASIAEDFGNDPKQAALWREQARKLRDSINENLWSEKNNAYLDSFEGTKTNQQPQIYALIYNLPEEGRKASMCELVKKCGKASEQSFAYWTLKAMFDQGHQDWAFDYMRQNWGEQTKLDSFNGAWHEGWDLPWGATSHAWSSGPVALLSGKVLGVEPTDYGWKTFSVKPYTGDLSWAKGTVATVSGDIHASWSKSASGKFTLKLTVPQNTSAEVYLPCTDAGTVKINGKPLADSPNVKVAPESEQWTALTVQQGDYRFECRPVSN